MPEHLPDVAVACSITPLEIKFKKATDNEPAWLRTIAYLGKRTMETNHRHSVGFVRREFIQVGFSGQQRSRRR